MGKLAEAYSSGIDDNLKPNPYPNPNSRLSSHTEDDGYSQDKGHLNLTLTLTPTLIG